MVLRRPARSLTLVDDVAFGVLREDVPLNGETVETDHAVEFRHDEEDERVEQTVVVGVHADEVRVEAARVREHAHEMREHQEEEEEGRNELNHPEGRVFVTEKAIVSLDVTALTVGGREATQGAQSVDHDANEDEADENDVHPEVFFTVDEGAARGFDEVREEVLAEVHGARERHVAEEEKTEDEAGNGLSDVAEGEVLAAALRILEADAPDVFGRGRGVAVLDGIRGRHDDWS